MIIRCYSVYAALCIAGSKSVSQLMKDVQVYPASLAVCSNTVLHTAGENTE